MEHQSESPRPRKSIWSYSIYELLLATTFFALTVYSLNAIVESDVQAPIEYPSILFCCGVGGFVGVFARRNAWLTCVIGMVFYLIFKLISMQFVDPFRTIIH